jgi:hypothetical protein
MKIAVVRVLATCNMILVIVSEEHLPPSSITFYLIPPFHFVSFATLVLQNTASMPKQTLVESEYCLQLITNMVLYHVLSHT